MQIDAIELIWIGAEDWKEAVKFYAEILGLKLLEYKEELGWAELVGARGGMRLGIARIRGNGEVNLGKNAIISFSVPDLEKAKDELMRKGVSCLGPIKEIPGHVKIQSFADGSGNCFQLLQKIN